MLLDILIELVVIIVLLGFSGMYLKWKLVFCPEKVLLFGFVFWGRTFVEGGKLRKLVFTERVVLMLWLLYCFCK